MSIYNRHKGPAFQTNVSSGATGSYPIIVCHIDIKHELSLDWFKSISGNRVTVLRLDIEDSSNINLMRLSLLNCSFHCRLIGKRLVADVDIIFDRERPFPPSEAAALGGGRAVVGEPGEHGVVGEQSRVVDTEQVKREILGGVGHGEMDPFPSSGEKSLGWCG